MEIERKFLVGQVPSGFEKFRCDDIEQSYLSFEPEMRVRKKSKRFFYTEKSDGTLVREENEREITENEYLRLKSKSVGRTITKKRYYIPLDAHTIELDVYGGEHVGLIVAEVEFCSVEDSGLFSPPAWFGREVTYDREFRNKVLASKND